MPARPPPPADGRPISARCEQAIADVETRHVDPILPVTTEVVRVWARISVRPINMADGFIAATALVHGLAVVTRNVQHFQETGAAVLNPFG
ncbi:PIN domain-containing protein [Nocardia colli]|nr:PIN domain-containing protein [Nocardia colli]